MQRTNYFNDQRVTKDDLNNTESSKSLVLQRELALLLARYVQLYSSSTPVNFQQASGDDVQPSVIGKRGIGGGYGSNFLATTTGSVSQISVNRGWAVTENMDILIITGSVTINKNDNSFNQVWTSVPNATMYVTAEYQEASSSVGNDSSGVSYYTRYTSDWLVRVSNSYPSNSSQIVLAQFTSDGSGNITSGTYVDRREFFRIYTLDSAVILEQPRTVSSLFSVQGHVRAVGSATPTITNPHGTSLSDLGYTDTTVTHRQDSHVNAIIPLTKDAGAFQSYSMTLINLATDVIIFSSLVDAYAIINGSIFSGSVTPLTGSVVSNGKYWIVSDVHGTSSLIATASIDLSDPIINNTANRPYLRLGRADVNTSGDITNLEDLRPFYVNNPYYEQFDFSENVSNPSGSTIGRSGSIVDNLNRMRYEIGNSLHGWLSTGSVWYSPNPLTSGTGSSGDPYHRHAPQNLIGVSASVTATNLNILTAGPTSDASSLHMHSAFEGLYTGVLGVPGYALFIKM